MSAKTDYKVDVECIGEIDIDNAIDALLPLVIDILKNERQTDEQASSSLLTVE